ncbi:divalent-cation tolerance protein CutA [bacterium]|nr:divalent-cation tolerance protein CutA [bacterium]
MKETSKHALLMITTPDPDTARSIAQGALRKRLAACVQINSGVESHYWWDGKIQSAMETMVLFKTRKDSSENLAAFIQQSHPYDTPEIIELSITKGSESYLNWIDDQTKQEPL